MSRTFRDDIVEAAVGGLAVIGALSIISAIANSRSVGNSQAKHYTLSDLRSETHAGFSLANNEIERLKNRVTLLERENARLRPFADFLEKKEKETDGTKIPIPKPKNHLWR